MKLLLLLGAVLAFHLKDTIGLFHQIQPKANLTHTVSKLKKGSGSDLQTLAELYLFGLNLNDYTYSPTDDFVGADGLFKRDFDKAFDYLLQAKIEGNAEAYFYIAFALQQAYLIADFDGKIGRILDTRYNFLSNYQAALDYGSRLAQATVSPYVMQCVNEQFSKPSFMTREEVLFYRGPFKIEDGCGGPCEDGIVLIATEASAAVEFIQSAGTEVNKIEHLGEVDALEPFGESATKAKLYKENMALEQGDNYVDLAQQHIAGNPQAGIEPDPNQAFRYYDLAAAQGNMQAMETLGLMYAQGIGTEKNTTRALELVNKAADQGSVAAISELAYMNYHGIGVPQNTTKAFELYIKAAGAGHVESMSNAGVFYLNGEGTEKDYDKAFLYFSLAAQGEHPNGIFNLGLMHYQGRGTEADCELAREHFHRVIAKGEAPTLASKAYKLYRDGDLLGAYLYYALASFLGVESAQISAALMWERGEVPLTCRNGPEHCAASYYMLALEQHESDWAADRLGDMEFKRNNYTKAYEYYEISNSAYGIYNVGYLNQEGLGCEKNLTEAELWYRSVALLQEMELYTWDESLPAFFAWLYVKILQWPVVSWLTSLIA
mmetsp:Transcript_26245/g.46915  ORF Transcript_26245/g.46915 Transcript_26245/m.46915 type:complete len:604 (+) Transcript_26245:132-1943(+)